MELQDLIEARSATFALVHKVRSMRGTPDPGPVADTEHSAGYRGGPICPRYTAEDLAKYERELRNLDAQIAAWPRST